MIYYLKRVILVGVLTLLAVNVLRKKAIRSRVKPFWMLVLLLIVYVILIYLPFENMYMTFPSPEEACAYNNDKELNVVCKIQGEDSTLLVSRVANADHYILVPRTDAGWKIGTGFEINNVAERIQNKTLIKIIQYQGHDDYYVILFDLKDSIHTISDQVDSTFFELQKNNSALSTKVYISHIVDIQTDYYDEINGIKYFAFK